MCPLFFDVMFLVSLILCSNTNAIRSIPDRLRLGGDGFSGYSMRFMEAQEYKNGEECAVFKNDRSLMVCEQSVVHVAMTIDLEYLRGSMAAIHSILKHTSCPRNIFFHFISSNSSSLNPSQLGQIVESSFPSLNFDIYAFDESLVNNLISSSIRQALENPLNYARSYLTKVIPLCVEKVIYLDSDVILVDDIQKLWGISLTGGKVIGAPEYCHTNYTKYFSDEFWANEKFFRVFLGKRACYFNTGVMVMDLGRWREGNYTKEIEKWMRIQKEKRIYELGSLPPFLLVFGGEIEAIDHRWNQHGLGGDNLVKSCRSMHPGPASLLHWSGKGKPWARLDAKIPCPIDYLWAPYDLYKPHFLNQHPQQ